MDIRKEKPMSQQVSTTDDIRRHILDLVELEGDAADLRTVLPHLTAERAVEGADELWTIVESINAHEAEGSNACHGRCIDPYEHVAGLDPKVCVEDLTARRETLIAELIEEDTAAGARLVAQQAADAVALVTQIHPVLHPVYVPLVEAVQS